MTQLSQQPKQHILTNEQVERIRSGKPSKPLSPEHRAKLAAGLARWRAAKQTAKFQPPQPVETAQVWEGREFR